MGVHVTKSEFKEIMKNYHSKNNNDIKISQNRGVKMRNKLTDLNNYLFEQLERLNDDDLSEEEFKREIARSKAVTDVSNAIINNANIALKGAKFLEEQGYNINNNDAIKLLGVDDDQVS